MNYALNFKCGLFHLLMLLLLAAAAFDQNSVQAQNWVLTWSDEFSGTGAPDSTKWDRPEYNRRNNPSGPDGWWEQDDSYLDGNGNLVIRVRRVPDRNGDGDPYDYNVGAVRTAGKFTQTYGKFEIRAQMPVKQGWWVAFWMMQGNQGSIGNGGVDGSEVDIMEGWGWTDKINHAIHWDGYGANHQSVGDSEIIPGIRTGWHTFTLIWEPTVYIFYVDGVEHWRSTGGGICNQPGYIKITGEISTEAWAITDSWAKDPAPVTFPDYFLVDYVRVYRSEAPTGPTFYPDASYAGNGVSLAAGNYSLSQLQAAGIANDSISSLKVPSGYSVTIYQDDNFAGSSWTFTADDASLADNGCSDAMTSVKITSTSAGGITSGSVYRLTPKLATTRAVEAQNGGTSDGTQAQIGNWQNISRQKWRVTDVGGGYYKLVPQHATTKALDVSGSGTADGTKIQIWGDNSSSAQKWKIVDVGGGYYKLQPQCAPSSCLDLKNSQTASGTVVQLWTDNGTDAQRWKLELQ